MMEEGIPNCDVGSITETQCHLDTYTNQKKLYKLHSLPVEDITVLRFRIDNFHTISNGKICDHHKYIWLNHYSSSRRKCCDPFNKHDKTITTDLRLLPLEICESAMKNLLIKLIPGDKVCKRCESLLKIKVNSEQTSLQSSDQADIASGSKTQFRQSERIKTQEKVSYCAPVLPESQSSVSSIDSSKSSNFITLSQEFKVIDTVLDTLDLPCLKNQPFFKTRRINYAENIVEDVCKNFAEKLSEVSGVTIEVPEAVYNNIFEDNIILQKIIINLQKEFESTKLINKKLEYLALLPIDFNQSKIQRYFYCTDYMYSKLTEYREMDDFPDCVKYHHRKSYAKYSLELQQLIRDYYTNEENTYTCPGKKDYVSIKDDDGRKILIQKKLLLYTVHDLYLKFKTEYNGSEKLPSFSYFMSLKPPECIHAGDPGSHTICVCIQHQNVKLKLYALSRRLKYRDLLQGAVCNDDEEKCMLKKCNKCPGRLGVSKTFDCIIEEQNIELKEGTIKYKVWIEKGSAGSLETAEDDVDAIKTSVCEDINYLTIHHYVADIQKQYLNHCKRSLELDTCIIVMDFSENYSFIIQQSVQSFYYNNSQATLHPFCMYFKSQESDELQNINFCVISDTKDHVAYTVNAFTANLMSIIKDQFSWIKSVIYFSDGAPQQYKNKNHLANILCHEKDFGIKVSSYNFFATNHGKSSCDATAGSVKRQTMRHCIRSPPERQITNAREMYTYAVNEIKTIRALWIPDSDVQKYEKKLRQRFSSVTTFPDTRKHHCYIPIEGKSMKMKITSLSTNEKVVNLNLK